MKPGEHRLRDALRRIRKPRPRYLPNSTEWAADIEHRLDRLEARQKWLLALCIAILTVVVGIDPQRLAQIINAVTTGAP